MYSIMCVYMHHICIYNVYVYIFVVYFQHLSYFYDLGVFMFYFNCTYSHYNIQHDAETLVPV